MFAYTHTFLDFDFFIPAFELYRCGSFVGRQFGEQRVSISGICLQKHTILHELGHVIGFHHEHNRPDRDEYIRIIEENVRSSSVIQFRKLSHSQVNLFGIGYDYNSIMHYDSDRYSNGHNRATIVAHDSSIPIGEADSLSPLDILKTNLLCGCSSKYNF